MSNPSRHPKRWRIGSPPSLSAKPKRSSQRTFSAPESGENSRSLSFCSGPLSLSCFGPGRLVAFAGINQDYIAVVFHPQFLQYAFYALFFLPRKKYNYLDRSLRIAGFFVDLGLLLKILPQMIVFGQFELEDG